MEKTIDYFNKQERKTTSMDEISKIIPNWSQRQECTEYAV